MNTPSIKDLTAESLALIDAIEERERRLVAAIEDLSQDGGAFNAGIQHERERVLTLISSHLDLLRLGGTNALALVEALRRQVLEVQE